MSYAFLTPETPAFAQEQQANAKARRPAIRSDADARRIVRLVRETFAAVHQANVSGNYAVFRDLAAPSLRSSMSLLDLANYFAPLRKQKADLGRALLALPKFREKPLIVRNKFLVLKGYIPGQPRRIAFDFTYQRVGGRWRFVNIAIRPVTAKADAATPENKKPQQAGSATARTVIPPAPSRRPFGQPKKAAAPSGSALQTTTIAKTPSPPESPEEEHWPMRLWYSLPLTGGR
ncbi:hypothetical protein BXY53_2494 [Dichotomicrobium thermohalophilum]|uniref:Uncharacterized protein n=2 Tax=Dichotomicrobium thermohalophilum TaxID=933063 RepID=A0A397PJG3_9HYPH|nr:hypothetical protein BXY53_2494 [Dichotomicrobium thermohalophilum]